MCVSHCEPADGKPVLSSSVVAVLEDLTTRLAESTSLATMVSVALVGVRKVGVLMLQAAIEDRDGKYRLGGCKVPCPECARDMKRSKNLRKVGRLTLLGKVIYRRSSWWCPGCDHRVFPVDAEIEVPRGLHGHSLEFGSSIVLLCVVVPFGKGCELFGRLAGFAVSTRLARALTFELGTKLFTAEMEHAKELWSQRITHPEVFEPTGAALRSIERHRRVYVMTDNSKVGIQEGKRGRKATKLKSLLKQAKEERRKASRATKRVVNGPDAPPAANTDMAAMLADDGSWRDVRAILIFREEDLAQVSKTRRQIVHRRVLAHVGTKEEWTQLVHMVFHEEGVYTAHEVVVVADGGTGIWELFDEMLPSTTSRKVVQILDWYHAASHLWAVGRALNGSKTPQQRASCSAWVKGLLDYLAEGKVANVIQRLEKLTGLKGTSAETVRKCIGYFKDHRNRMRYAWCRKHGMLIGSGAIESVHAWVIQARCRLPGMRWSEAGINAMLRLRCSWASGRWDEDFASGATNHKPTPRQIKAAA